MKDSDYVKINSVNSLHLIIDKVDRYIEEGNGNKYLIIASTDENKVLIKYTELWNEVKYLIKTINGGEASEYRKGYMKIKFNSNDKLPSNKMLNFII